MGRSIFTKEELAELAAYDASLDGRGHKDPTKDSERRRAQYQANQEERRAKARAYYQKNRETILRKQKETKDYLRWKEQQRKAAQE